MTLTVDPQAGNTIGKATQITDYILAASNDTTDPANGPAIRNDGSITKLSMVINVTDKTGTDPTVNLQLQGSNDGTNWVNVPDSGGTAIATGALDISSADSTTVVDGIDINEEGLTLLPYTFLRGSVDVGGTSTPGWTGAVDVTYIRN